MNSVAEVLKSLWIRKRDIYQHVTDIPYLYLNREKELINVDLEICTNSFGFSYSQSGWHPIIALLREVDSNHQLLYSQDSVFFKYYEKYQPVDMLHLVNGLYSQVSFAPPLGILPWGGFSKETMRNGGSPLKNTSWLTGPLDNDSIRLNIKRSIDLLNNVKRYGYKPWMPQNSFVEGCFLEKEDGDKRFVVIHGKHRAAVLSYLGFDHIMVRYAPEAVKVIHENDVHTWFYVKNRKCSVDDALAYFNAYFELNGKERARNLGLLK